MLQSPTKREDILRTMAELHLQSSILKQIKIKIDKALLFPTAAADMNLWVRDPILLRALVREALVRLALAHVLPHPQGGHHGGAAVLRGLDLHAQHFPETRESMKTTDRPDLIPHVSNDTDTQSVSQLMVWVSVKSPQLLKPPLFSSVQR